jgi:5-dehydro-4-deoxyglucarate dehydratase
VTTLPPDDLAAALKSGLLSFPVTHFDSDLRFDEPRYREHLAWQASYDVAGLFAAGGTGEGFSVRTRDRAKVYELLNGFVLPYIDIRDRAKGYAVSIIKAGLTAVGRDGGRVRPPLTDLTDDERAELTALIEKVS